MSGSDKTENFVCFVEIDGNVMKASAKYLDGTSVTFFQCCFGNLLPERLAQAQQAATSFAHAIASEGWMEPPTVPAQPTAGNHPVH